MGSTPLDRAHAAMETAPNDDLARLRFFERLADCELFLMLARDPEDADIEPEVFEIEGGRLVLAFDREERLADFANRIVPYAALSGRALAGLLAGQGLGLGLNLGVAPSSIVIPAEAIEWLAGTLAERPSEIEDRPQEILPPGGLPDAVLTALDAKLSAAAGLARSAYLVAVRFSNGASGHLLAFVGTVPGAEAALAQATGEALTFSGVEAGSIDVGFFADSDPVAPILARVGLRFDLPTLRETVASNAPGTDPSRPPRLR